MFLLLINTSATQVEAEFRSDTGQGVIFTVSLSAEETVVMALPVPIKADAVNDNWTAKLSGSVTNVQIFAIAVKNT